MSHLPIIGFLFVYLALLDAGAPEDRELARRIREGDPRAFRAFFDRYHGVLFDHLRRRGVSAGTSEDAVQAAFLTLWERRREIDEGQSLRAFLFKVGYHRAIDDYRAEARRSGGDTGDDPRSDDAPDADAEYALLRAALLRVVASLPERRRAVFELCFLEGLTYQEAAEALGISVKTVEHQMGHALKTIRTALEVYRKREAPA